MSKKVEMVSRKFNSLLVLEEAGRNNDSRGKLLYKCLCDCGNLVEVVGEKLRNDSTKSCGCYRDNHMRILGLNTPKKYTEEERLKYKKASNARKHANRRARELSVLNDLTKEDIDFIFYIQRGECPSCGEYLDNYHIDHIQPVSKGGDFTITNIQLLCPHCNLSKNDKDTDYLARYIYKKVLLTESTKTLLH